MRVCVFGALGTAVSPVLPVLWITSCLFIPLADKRVGGRGDANGA